MKTTSKKALESKVARLTSKMVRLKTEHARLEKSSKVRAYKECGRKLNETMRSIHLTKSELYWESFRNF